MEYQFPVPMKVEECGNCCKACQPTELAHEGKGFGSTTSFGSPIQPTFCVPSTPNFGPLNSWISNNCSGLEIKFELAGGTLFTLNIPQASTVSVTTSTWRTTVPSPLGRTLSGGTTVCRTAIPSLFGRATFEAAANATPFGNLPAGANTTCGTTHQSQFGIAPCQTSTSCAVTSLVGPTVTFKVGGTPCTTCSTSPCSFHTPQVGSYTRTPAKVSLPRFKKLPRLKKKPQTQCTGTKMAACSPTLELDGCGVISGGLLQSISAMPAYRKKSVEELRWEDYRMGHKGSYTKTPAKVSLPHFKTECQTQCTGTKIAAYSPTHDLDCCGVTSSGLLQSISSMPAYSKKSVEELRWEDYQMGHEESYSRTPAKVSLPCFKEEPQMQCTGTKIGAYSPTLELDGCGVTSGGLLQSISAMPAYCNKSVEELRWQDNWMGHEGQLRSGSKLREGPCSSSTKSSTFAPPTSSTLKFSNSPIFGFHEFGTSSDHRTSSAFWASSSIFSKTTPSSAFSSSFTSGVNSSVPLFGAANTTASSSLNSSVFSSVPPPMSIPSAPPHLYPFSNSKAATIFGKPQVSGTAAPSIFGMPSVSAFGTSCSTPDPFSNLTTISLFGKPQTSGNVAAHVFGTPPGLAFGNHSTASSNVMSTCRISSFGSTAKSEASSSVSSTFGFGKNQLSGSASFSAPSFSSEPYIGWTPSAFGQSSPFGNTSANLFAEPLSSPNVQPSINPFSQSLSGSSTSPSIGSRENLFASNVNVIIHMGSGQPTPCIPTEFQANPATSSASRIHDVSDAFTKVTKQ